MPNTLTLKQPVTIKEQTVISIVTSEGFLEIFKTVDSGKVVTREKIDTLTKVFHPGVIIGKDIYNRVWVAHNHYSNNRPTFDLLETFRQEKEVLPDNRPLGFSKQEIVTRAIAEVNKGKTYHWLTYNCQHFVNTIVRAEHTSEAVDRITDTGIGAGLLLSLIGLLAENKTMVTAGLAIAGVSGASKVASRL